MTTPVSEVRQSALRRGSFTIAYCVPAIGRRRLCEVSRWNTNRPRTLLSTHQAAEILEIHPSSLIKWINDGLLDAQRTPGGHRRIQVSDLVKFLREHDMHVPEALTGVRQRLLWVDDDPHFLKAVQRGLKKASYDVDVRVCDNPVDALVQVGAFKPHVIVVDIFMPGMDGFEVCRRLKSNPETADLHVVFVTGALEPDHEVRAREAGAHHVLEKPADVRDVLALLDTLREAA